MPRPYRTSPLSWRISSKTSSKRRKRKATISQETKAIRITRTAETTISRARATTGKTEARVLKTNVKSTEATSGASVVPTQKTKVTINAPADLNSIEATQVAGATLGTRASTCQKKQKI